jgi:hypothetical protein
MKFKLLSDQELQNLETEFVQFLVANGVDDALWRKINDQEPDKALKLVEAFSDVVWEKALQKVEVIEHLTDDSVKLFWYLQNKAVLVGVNLMDKSEGTLSKENWVEMLKNTPEAFEIYSQQKEVDPKGREAEIFKLLESGCAVSTIEEFRWLHAAFQKLSGANPS